MKTNPCQTNSDHAHELNHVLAPTSRRKFLTTFGATAAGVVMGGNAFAKSPVKLQNWEGTIDFSTEDISPFTLAGTASHLGKFTANGEVKFVPGDEEGSLVGDGVVAFTAADGDVLVGVVSWDADPASADLRSSHIHFSWRDSVPFSDGTITSTGRFAHDRPRGLVVIAIIAILIGLLVPAVQKDHFFDD